MADERRDEDRAPVSLEARWEGMSGKHEARISDISIGGCFVDTQGQVTVGELVIFEVKLPDGDWLTLRGEVVSSQESVGFGVRFPYLTDEEYYLLAQLKSSI